MRFSPLNRSLNVVFITYLVFMIIINRTIDINVQRGDECFFLDSKLSKKTSLGGLRKREIRPCDHDPTMTYS